MAVWDRVRCPAYEGWGVSQRHWGVHETNLYRTYNLPTLW